MPGRVKYEPPAKGTTEIRIHGVGGTTPDNMLGDPHPIQVAGDDRAGFYRPEGEQDDGAPTVEAYSWGGLTSRKSARALWILLLPFTLTNVAGWMVVHRRGRKGHELERRQGPRERRAAPAPANRSDRERRVGRPDRRKRDRLAEAQERLCRLTAAIATMLMVVGAAAITGDLVAVQCGRWRACRSGRVWMSLFAGDWAQHQPLRRLTVGLLPPVLLLVALVWLSRRNRQEYEEDFGPKGVEAGDDADLYSKNFWHRPSIVRDLAWLHAGVTLALLSLLLVWSTKELRGLYDLSESTWTSILAAASGLALVIGCGWIVSARPKRGTWDAKTTGGRSHRAYAIIGGGLLVAAGVTAWRVDLGSVGGRELQTFSSAPFYILVIGALVATLISFLQLGGWWLREPNQVLRKLMSVVLIVAALALIVVPMIVDDFPWISVIYAVLSLEVVAAATYWLKTSKSQWVAVTSALLGLGMGVWAMLDVEPEWAHGLAIAALLASLLILSDAWWERTEFRWGAPAIISLLGIVLLSAVLAGAATRTAEFLDKRQSPEELREQAVTILTQEEEAGRLRLSDMEMEPIKEALDKAIANDGYDEPHLAERLKLALTNNGIKPSIARLVYLMAAEGDHRPIKIEIADAYEWLTVGITGAVLLSAFAMLALYLAFRYDRKPPDEKRAPVRKDKNARDLTPGEEEGLQKSIRSMKTLKEAAGGGDLLVSFIVGLLVIGAAVTIATRLDHPLSPANWVDAPFPNEWPWALTLSGWFVTALPLLAAAAIRKSYTSEESRRKIGIVWDLATFWPRRFHPLSPPSYSERAVPELQDRVKKASGEGKCVVVAAHSQGSVVAYAALRPLGTDKAPYISLLTYGSPLGSYYRRFFPRYFDTRDFDALEKRLQAGTGAEHSWRNFWRPTDPIAGCVFSEFEDESETRDRRVDDPWWWWRIPGQPLPHLQVHSDYMDDETLREWVRGAAARCPKDGQQQRPTVQT